MQEYSNTYIVIIIFVANRMIFRRQRYQNRTTDGKTVFAETEEGR